MPIDMLDRRLVSPGDLFARQAEDGGDAVALGGAGRPAAQDDRRDAAFLQPRLLRQSFDVDLEFQAQIADGFGRFHRGFLIHGVRPNCGPWPYRCDTSVTWPQLICSAVTTSALAT